MASALTHTIRSRWFALSVHAGLWLLLYLALVNLGGKAPEYKETSSYSVPTQSLAPVAKLDPLLASSQWSRASALTNVSNPFYTTHFVPPAQPPPPPPPTTKKIPVVYQGFYVTDNGPVKALLKLPDGFVMVPIGASVATNNFVAYATMQTLTLTNQAGLTNLLQLNTQTDIEVPAK